MPQRVLGKSVTNKLLQWTFFGHFCGGTKECELRPTVDRLKKQGVGTIFDYAAENDVNEKPGVPAAAAGPGSPLADEEMQALAKSRGTRHARA